LSNFSCGFVTEIDANLENFWYFGWLKNRMNNYFMHRYLRRDPLKFDFSYRLKCHGCAKCLNEENLKLELEKLISNNLGASLSSSSSTSSLFKIFYNKFNRIVQVNRKEKKIDINKEKKIEKLKHLIELSKYKNENCDKQYNIILNQSQLISTINLPNFEDSFNNNLKDDTSFIDTVIVKDPEFNEKQMNLADRKELKEFMIRKLKSNRIKENSNDREGNDLFSISIDGEIYKLTNNSELNLNISVKHLEKYINLIKLDLNSANIVINPWPRIYQLSDKTLNEHVYNNDSNNDINFQTVI
jgi:hypothetical protein